MLTRAAKLVRQLSERAIAFLQAIVARLFGRTLIDANAAPAHLMHHRQQIDVETIGGAGALLVEDRIQVSQIARSVAIGSASA